MNAELEFAIVRPPAPAPATGSKRLIFSSLKREEPAAKMAGM
jgi:hypothetical protein